MTGSQAWALAEHALPLQWHPETGQPRWTDGQRGRLAESILRDERPTPREMDVALATRTLLRLAPAALS